MAFFTLLKLCHKHNAERGNNKPAKHLFVDNSLCYVQRYVKFSYLREPIMHTHTKDYYRSNAQNYAKRTLSIDVDDIRGRFMAYLAPGSSILDVGCGSGRDLCAFTESGFPATGVDSAEEMCASARRHSGCKVYNTPFENFTPCRPHDGIWAMASLVHLPDKDMPPSLQRIWSWLKKGGIFYASFKDKSGAGVTSDGRVFNGFSLDEVTQLFGNLQGAEVLETWSTQDETRHRVWQNIILRKN